MSHWCLHLHVQNPLHKSEHFQTAVFSLIEEQPEPTEFLPQQAL